MCNLGAISHFGHGTVNTGYLVEKGVLLEIKKEKSEKGSQRDNTRTGSQQGYRYRLRFFLFDHERPPAGLHSLSCTPTSLFLEQRAC